MKLLIIDDHSILREGVAEILRQADLGTVMQASTIEQGLEISGENADIGIILLDLEFPSRTGFSAIADFRNSSLAPIIILSSSEDPGHVRQAMALGARGYVPKSAGAATLVAAIRLVLEGGVHVPSSLAEVGAPAVRGTLTRRQMDVLSAICDGLSNRDIGHRLGLSEKTVKVHVTAIFKALNVVNRTQATKAARTARLCD